MRFGLAASTPASNGPWFRPAARGAAPSAKPVGALSGADVDTMAVGLGFGLIRPDPAGED